MDRREIEKTAFDFARAAGLAGGGDVAAFGGIVKPRARVLAIVDAPRWAHDVKTQSLARWLSGDYEIIRRFAHQLTREDLEQADVVLVYYWHQFVRMSLHPNALIPYREKLLCGVCSHIEIEGPLRSAGIEVLNLHSSGVFVNNLLLAHELQPLLDLPVFYTPNGVDCSFFQPGPPRSGPRKLRVGWAGSLSNHGRSHRGFDDFIVPAVAAVEGAELISAARETHWRSSAEMLEFYRSIDVYLCASRSEGTPNPCLEAAACGVPLVTTRVGNMPELVQDGVNGFFVERSVSDIAAKLSILQENPRLRTAMGHAARKAIQDWDWKRQAVNYRRMFDTFLERIGRSPGNDGICSCLGSASRADQHADLFVSDPSCQVTGRRVVVFGAGKAGLDCLDSFEEATVFLGFVDNAPEKQGTTVRGHPVHSPAELRRMNQDLILVASFFWPEIVLQLSQLGFVAGRDFLVL